MTIPNAEHLLDQSAALLSRPRGGRHRQTDLRRAISTAYYAVFHTVLTAFADRIAGRAKRTTPQYVHVYRGLDHRTLGGLCAVATRPSVPPKYSGLLPPDGFGPAVRVFSLAVLDLQRERHLADFDPGWSIRPSDANALVRSARDAIAQWVGTPAEQREAFLLLLLLPPR